MDEGQGDEEADAGGGESNGGAGVLGDEAPGDGTEGHAALEGHEVCAEGAGGDPGGDGELDGGVDAGHGAGPGGAGEDEDGDDDPGAAIRGEDDKGEGLVKGGGEENVVGREAAADARELGGGDDGSDAECAIEDAVADGSAFAEDAGQIVSGDDGEQRPDGGDEEAVGEGTDE